MSLRDLTTIDLITEHPTEGYVALIMTADEDWQDPELPRVLQDKLNAYLSYALDGQLSADYPDLARKRLRIQLDCVAAPPKAIRDLVDRMAARCGKYGVEFIINILLTR